MDPPPIELVVADEAVMLRRSVQGTGKRGISVGYPGGVNVTFDAERLGLNQIWWGRFVDARGVWTSQGHGQARILGEKRVVLPNGPAFAELDGRDAPWPTATRRELGQRWLGYDLDDEQRPSFRYACAGVEVTAKPLEVPAAGRAGVVLRRELRFRSESDKTIWFRAARDARIDDAGDGRLQVGSSLRIAVPGGAYHVRDAGDERELVVAVAITNGEAELVIDYHWVEDDR
jgi:hypothetical protein